MRDFPRMAWWSLKGVRFNPLAVASPLLAIAVTGVLFWLIENGNARLILADLVILVAAFALVVLAASAVVWIVYALRSRSRIYMSPSRRAAIVMTEDRHNARWELKNHVVQHTGVGLGAALREAMAEPMQAAATAANVELYGNAANEKVQKLYLDQFKSWGLSPQGKKAVVWKPAAGSIPLSAETERMQA